MLSHTRGGVPPSPEASILALCLSYTRLVPHVRLTNDMVRIHPVWFLILSTLFLVPAMSRFSSWPCSAKCNRTFSTTNGRENHRRTCQHYRDHLASLSQSLHAESSGVDFTDLDYYQVKRRKLAPLAPPVVSYSVFMKTCS